MIEGKVSFDFDPVSGDVLVTLHADTKMAYAIMNAYNRGGCLYVKEDRSYQGVVTLSTTNTPLEIETYYPIGKAFWPGSSLKAKIINKWNEWFPQYAVVKMNPRDIVEEVFELREWKYQVERAFITSMNYPYEFDLGIGWAKRARQVVEGIYKNVMLR